MMLLSGSGSTCARWSGVQSKTGPRMPQIAGGGIFSLSSILLFLQNAQCDPAIAGAAVQGSKIHSKPVPREALAFRHRLQFSDLGFDEGFCVSSGALQALGQGGRGHLRWLWLLL